MVLVASRDDFGGRSPMRRPASLHPSILFGCRNRRLQQTYILIADQCDVNHYIQPHSPYAEVWGTPVALMHGNRLARCLPQLICRLACAASNDLNLQERSGVLTCILTM
jgi:hypothetical protein